MRKNDHCGNDRSRFHCTIPCSMKIHTTVFRDITRKYWMGSHNSKPLGSHSRDTYLISWMGYKTEVFHGLPQSLQETARIVSRATTTPHSFATHHLTIQCCIVWGADSVYNNIINGKKYTDGGYDLPYRCPQILKKSRSCHQILGVRRVTLMKFHFENPQFCSHLRMSLLSGAFSLVHVNWYTQVDLKKEKKCKNYADSIKCPYKTLIHPRDQVP